MENKDTAPPQLAELQSTIDRQTALLRSLRLNADLHLFAPGQLAELDSCLETLK